MANGNPFYVQPASPMPLLEGLNQVVSQKAGQMVADEKMKEIQAAARQAYSSGDPDQIADVMIKYPEFSKAVNLFDLRERKNKATQKNAIDAAWEYQRNPTDEMWSDVYNRRKSLLTAEGQEDQASTERLYQEGQKNPEARDRITSMLLAQLDPENWKQFRQGGAGKPTSNIQDFNFYLDLLKSNPSRAEEFGRQAGILPSETAAPTDIDDFVADAEKAWKDEYGTEMPPSKKNEARLQFKRAQAGEVAGVKEAEEEAKLRGQLKLKPEVEAAVTMAVEGAKLTAKRAGEQRSNDTALNMYETAMGGLADALGETTTGPGVGWLPALTVNAQIAEGAVAAMAPILKQMFRSAGEGTFTDRDQALLLKMVPTRNDLAEARVAKIKNIDAIVREKLGRPAQQDPKSNVQKSVGQPEGTIIENKSTKERRIMRNGKWEPYNG